MKPPRPRLAGSSFVEEMSKRGRFLLRVGANVVRIQDHHGRSGRLLIRLEIVQAQTSLSKLWGAVRESQ